jgi:hypothetical protein
MAEKGYLIGEGVRRKLKETFAKVDAIPYRGGSGKIPVESLELSIHLEPHYLAKTTAVWAKGASQTLTIWGGTPGQEQAEAGNTVEAWNKFSAIKANKWVMLARCNGTFYVISAEC